MKSFTRKCVFSHSLALFLLGPCLLLSCSKSDDQRTFEQEALRAPQNITETSGDPSDEGRTDSDDWRISPMYQGLIAIGQPYTRFPYPNPLHYNDRLILELYLRGVETLSGIEIHAVDSLRHISGPIASQNGLSSTSLVSFDISGSAIAGASGGDHSSGLYRILIFDSRQNIISYGDVRVQ